MKSRNQLYIFAGVWLAVFLLCSILSAVAYSTDDASPPSAPAQTDGNLSGADEIDPAVTTDPEDTGSEPSDPQPTTPYDQLTYSADNARYLIYVDAGHGWYDNGSSIRLTADGEYVYEQKDQNGKTVYVTESGSTVTEADFEYIYEKDINLELTKKLKQALEKMGYTVGETRPGDNDEDCPVELTKGIFYAKNRTFFVNEKEADYFISIHCNTFTDSSVDGTRIFYSSSRDVTLRLANSLMSSMQSDMSDKVSLSIDNQLYVLLYSNMPAVLIESGFITNHSDLTKLLDSDWQDQFVCAIAKGIDADLHA